MLSTKTIYVESQALSHPATKKIIDNICPSNIIEIAHYKDVFCRKNQNVEVQKDYQKIILAVKHDDFLYKGAPVCQDFGYDNFNYCSSVMNCVCNCEYCYLKGMYPSGYLVVFVNLDDYFKNFKNRNYYICATYDTDLFPLEKYLGYVRKWLEFAYANKNSIVEIRTKNKNLNIWNYQPAENVIFAFSLSPQNIIDKYEHKTSSLNARLENIVSAQEKKFKTRLCFDPIIYCENWKSEYKALITKTFSSIDMSKIKDISVGSFRISQSYLKNMRKNNSKSSIVNFPFTNIAGYYQYDLELQKSMEEFVLSEISKYYPQEKVFLWK